jgi:hypothetical protein
MSVVKIQRPNRTTKSNPKINQRNCPKKPSPEKNQNQSNPTEQPNQFVPPEA